MTPATPRRAAGPPVPGAGRPGAWRVGIVLAATAVLLAAVAAASAADRLPLPGVPSRVALPSPFTGALASAGAIALILAVELTLAASLGARLILRRPGAQGGQVRGWRRVAESLGPFAFVGMLALLVIVLHHLAGVRRRAPTGGAAGVGRGLPRPAVGGGGRAGLLTWNEAALVATVAVVLLALVAAAFVALRARAARRVGRAAVPEVEPRAGSSPGGWRRRRPATPREAVCAAFDDLEERGAALGVPRRPHETPAAFLQRAVPAPGGGGASAQRLADLYAAARYSPHLVDAAAAGSAAAAAAELARALRRPVPPADG